MITTTHLDKRVGVDVDVSGGLVHDQDLVPPEHRAGQAHQLPLPKGKVFSPFAHLNKKIIITIIVRLQNLRKTFVDRSCAFKTRKSVVVCAFFRRKKKKWSCVRLRAQTRARSVAQVRVLAVRMVHACSRKLSPLPRPRACPPDRTRSAPGEPPPGRPRWSRRRRARTGRGCPALSRRTSRGPVV